MVALLIVQNTPGIAALNRDLLSRQTNIVQNTPSIAALKRVLLTRETNIVLELVLSLGCDLSCSCFSRHCKRAMFVRSLALLKFRFIDINLNLSK